MPIETPDGRAIEITIHRTKDDGAVMVIQDVTERRNAQREINRMALFDPVTELPNRRFSRRSSRWLSVPIGPPTTA